MNTRHPEPDPAAPDTTGTPSAAPPGHPENCLMKAKQSVHHPSGAILGSGGLNVGLALQAAREVKDPAARVVSILCDTGERYLSKLFDDAWIPENQLLDPPRITVEC